MMDLSIDKVVRLSLIAGVPLLSIFAVRGALESPRPTITPLDERPAMRHEDVEARLWQDPFSPVLTHEEDLRQAGSPDDDHHGPAQLTTQIVDFVQHDDVLLLPVMVSGASYPEDVERRKRSRYAVISALYQQDYHPTSNRHIGYVRLNWPSTDAENDAATDHDHDTEGDTTLQRLLVQVHAEAHRQVDDEAGHTHEGGRQPYHRREPLVVPFEWFRSANGGRRVLVIWVAEDFVGWPTKASRSPGDDQDSDRHVAAPREAPLNRLSQLLHTMLAPPTNDGDGDEETLLAMLSPAGADGAADVANARSLTLRIVGPSSSATLEHMARESRHYRDHGNNAGSAPGAYQSLGSLSARFYSPWSTIEESLIGLTSENNPSWRRGRTSEYALQASPAAHSDGRPDAVPLIRTLHTDTEVLKAIIEELDRRGVDVACDDHHVVLISESDTRFGRTLPHVFTALAQAREGERFCYEAFARALHGHGSADDPPINIHRFTYLRGIDGRLPDSKAPAEAPAADGGPYGGLLGGERQRASEAAAGRGQLDYLRRKAQVLRTFDRDLRRGSVPTHGMPDILAHRHEGDPRDPDGEKLRGRIRAIGVLGSDVYDKMLVIQALRAEFPDAVFFTTDMDAIYDGKAEIASTRNLIVGSTFGLSLGPPWQGQIPPFRNTYQASVYLATRLALIDAEDKEAPFDAAGSAGSASTSAPDWPRQATQDWLGPPRLFEIGLRGHVDLTPTRANPDTGAWGLHPQQGVPGRGVGLLTAVGVFSVAMFLLARRVNAWTRADWEEHLKTAGRSPLLEPFVVTTTALAGGLALGWVLLWLGQMDGTGKPPFAMRGVSPWVSDGMYFAAGLVGFALGVKAIMILFSVQRQFCEQAQARAIRGVSRWCGRSFRPADAADDGRLPGRFGVSSAWVGPALVCLLGTLLLLLVFFIALAVNRWQFGGRSLGVPQRGDGGTLVRWALWWFAVAGTTFLVVCVSVAMTRCGRLARQVLTRTARLVRQQPLADARENTRLIRNLTRPIVGLVVYPLFALALLTIARLPVFDRWGWPPVLIGALVVLAVIPVWASVKLHWTAKGGREDIVERMRSARLFPPAIDQVRAINGGAFRPLWQDPVAEAALFPIAVAASILVLMQGMPAF